jgi:hypothetical protein
VAVASFTRHGDVSGDRCSREVPLSSQPLVEGQVAAVVCRTTRLDSSIIATMTTTIGISTTRTVAITTFYLNLRLNLDTVATMIVASAVCTPSVEGVRGWTPSVRLGRRSIPRILQCLRHSGVHRTAHRGHDCGHRSL